MNTKVGCLGVFFVIFAAVFMGTIASANPVVREIFYNVRVNFNGAEVDFGDDLPFIMNDRVFLPVRTIAELAGLDVDFFDGVVYLRNDGEIIEPASQENDFAFSFPYESPLGASVKIAEEKLPRPMSELEYIEAAAGLAVSEGMDVYYILDFPEITRIGNRDWYSYQTTMTMQILDISLNVFGHYFVRIEGETASVITIITSDVSETFDEIMLMLRGN